MTDTLIADSSAFPAPPRPLTPLARRRAWLDPRVRFWWVVSAALVLAGIILAITQLRLQRHEANLMGVPAIEATIVQADNETVKHRPIKPGRSILVEFPANDPSTQAWTVLAGYSGEAKTGEPIPVHVNPDDPTDVTVRNEPLTVSHALIGAIIAVAIAVLPLLAAIMARRNVLRTWVSGELRFVRILGEQQTPLAPRSRLVRCTWEDDADRRIFELYVPARALPSPTEDPRLPVLFPAGGKGRTLAAAWFSY